MVLEEAVDSLDTLGVEHAILQSCADGAVLVLPEYGRVLGVWPHRRGENALWINPDFLRGLRIGAKDDGWTNPGGDRMWLAPAAEFFVENAAKPGAQGVVPAAVDPGRYVRLPKRNCFFLENRGDIRAWRAGDRVVFRMTRRFRPLDPDQISSICGRTWLRQAGYEEEAVLEVQAGCPVSTRLWNLTQVRPGGEARVPLRKYWGDTGLADLPAGSIGLAEGCAVIGFRGEGAPKVGFRAEEVGSRVLYVEERDDGHAQLLVRQFARAAPDEYDGHFLECAGDASEISCLSPAVGGPAGRRRVRWRMSLCAFSGRAEEVKAFARSIAVA